MAPFSGVAPAESVTVALAVSGPDLFLGLHAVRMARRPYAVKRTAGEVNARGIWSSGDVSIVYAGMRGR
jgi:hypothetical protein